jgi:hypothetical protein
MAGAAPTALAHRRDMRSQPFRAGLTSSGPAPSTTLRAGSPGLECRLSRGASLKCTHREAAVRVSILAMSMLNAQ